MFQTLLIVCPLVFLAGFIDAIVGGGGLISLPAYLAAGLPAHAAAGTNKCGNMFGTILTTVRFMKNGKVHRQSAIFCAVLALIGSWIGAKLNMFLDERYLYYVLLVALPVIGLFIIFKPNFVNESFEEKLSPHGLIIASSAIGLGMGIYDGFFGPGTGTFTLLLFSFICGFDLLTANGNTKVLNSCSNIAAFFTFAVHGEIIWSVGIPAALCGIAGNYIGSSLALSNGAKIARPMFIVVFILLLIRCVYSIFA